MIFRPGNIGAVMMAISALLASATTAIAGVSLYYTTDEGDTHDMPTDAPEDPWNPVGEDGSVNITLEHRDRIWFAARNDHDYGRNKYLGLRIAAPTPQDMQALESCSGPGEEDAEGFMNPDDSPIPPVRTVFGGAKQIGNKYAVDYRMDPQPLWERFCFKCVSGAGIDGEFAIELFTSCSSPMDIPPFSAWFSMTDASFGASGAMIGDPRYTEVWVFPKSLPVDPDELATIAAPPETGPWIVEPVFADPDGFDRPLGGFRWLSDGAGLTTNDRFDVSFAMIEVADIKYDLFGYDTERAQFDRLTIVAPTWSDSLDTYEPGPLVGSGGWESWDNDPAGAGFLVTDEQAASPPHSVVIDGHDDAVRRLHGYTEGVWVVSAWQYVRASLDDRQFLILLNTYEAGGPKNWSLQLVTDGAAGAFADFNTGDALPLITDEWAEIRVMIDLQQDEQSVFYNGELLVTKSWTDGVSGDGALNVGALNLYGDGSAHPVYYDDIAIDEIAPIGACVLDDGVCEELFREACESFGGEYAGHGTICADLEPCPADFDQDGDVDTSDLLHLLGAWGTPDGDVDGDGDTDTADLLALLGAWGECP